ncbi:MAG: NAD(P)-dependent oxidoreductase [Solirubrobacterales bacterium]
MADRDNRPAGVRVVAVLGAGGTMGRGMVGNLAGGFEVRAWNRTAAKIADLADDPHVTVCVSAGEAAAGADAVLTVLSDGEAVLAAMEGDEGGLSGAAEGAIWLQASTIGIEATERCIELADRHHLVFVDAPVLGTKKPAEEGELVILGSGPEEARERLAPLFEAIGKRTPWAGPAGAGTRLKVAVNAWIVTVVEGAAEMLALAEAIGIDPTAPLDAIAEGPLDLPYLRLKAKAMLERDFTPSFRLALAAKDAGLALAAAEAEGLELPMLAAIRERMEEAAREHGDKDLAAVYLASSARD